MTDSEKHEQGADLIRQAFVRARESGLPEWQTMNTAVLKNRLLDLTERSFEESDWGASTFREFVEQFSDVIAVVPAVYPPRVTLLGDVAAPLSSPVEGRRDIGPRRRVRRDLWDAVLDYSSGTKYTWDGHRAVSVEGVPKATATLLPTLGGGEFRSWRTEFVREQSAQNADVASLLYGWLEREEPLAVLPTSLRIPWIADLKCRVVERLEDWFKAEGITPPQDILTEEPRPRAKVDTDVLRERVLSAVHGMSRAELESLQLPATVLLRNRN